MATIKRMLLSVIFTFAGMLVCAGIASADEITLPGGFTIQASAEIAHPVNTFVQQMPVEQKEAVADIATQIPVLPAPTLAPAPIIPVVETPAAPAPAVFTPEIDAVIVDTLPDSIPNMAIDALSPVVDQALKTFLSPQAYMPELDRTDAATTSLSEQLDATTDLFVSSTIHADSNACANAHDFDSKTACSLGIIDAYSGHEPGPAIEKIAPFSVTAKIVDGHLCGAYVLTANMCGGTIHVSPVILDGMAERTGYDEPTVAQMTGVYAHERHHAQQEADMANAGESLSAFADESDANTYALEQDADYGAGITMGNAMAGGTFTQDQVEEFIFLIEAISPDENEPTHGGKAVRRAAIENGIDASAWMQQTQHDYALVG